MSVCGRSGSIGWRAERPARVAVVAVVVVAAWAAPERLRAQGGVEGAGEATAWFPEDRPFRGPIADVREPRFGVGLAWTDLFEDGKPSDERPPFEFDSPDGMAVEVHGLARLGGTLPVWGTTLEDDSRLIVGLQAGVFARFRMEEPSRDAVGTDWLAALPIELARGELGWRLRLLHWSSHLGDELMQETGARRIEFGHEAVDLLLSRRVGGLLRVYGGGAYIFRSNTEHEAALARRGRSDKATAQLGAELVGARWAGGRVGPLAAVDWQVSQRTAWADAVSAAAGLEARGEARWMRVMLRYFTGPSPVGEFFLTAERFWGIELVIGL